MVIAFALLSIATAFVVYLKLKQASTLFNHLSVEDVKAYKKGQLSQEDRRHVTRHISYCNKCRDLMLNTDPDDILEHLVGE